jgi:hypothetical protein
MTVLLIGYYARSSSKKGLPSEPHPGVGLLLQLFRDVWSIRSYDIRNFLIHSADTVCVSGKSLNIFQVICLVLYQSFFSKGQYMLVEIFYAGVDEKRVIKVKIMPGNTVTNINSGGFIEFFGSLYH